MAANALAQTRARTRARTLAVGIPIATRLFRRVAGRILIFLDSVGLTILEVHRRFLEVATAGDSIEVSLLQSIQVLFLIFAAGWFCLVLAQQVS